MSKIRHILRQLPNSHLTLKIFTLTLLKQEAVTMEESSTFLKSISLLFVAKPGVPEPSLPAERTEIYWKEVYENEAVV